jgi:hypothetical protein
VTISRSPSRLKVYCLLFLSACSIYCRQILFVFEIIGIMGRQSSGILGHIRGKVGNLTFRRMNRKNFVQANPTPHGNYHFESASGYSSYVEILRGICWSDNDHFNSVYSPFCNPGENVIDCFVRINTASFLPCYEAGIIWYYSIPKAHDSALIFSEVNVLNNTSYEVTISGLDAAFPDSTNLELKLYQYSFGGLYSLVISQAMLSDSYVCPCSISAPGTSPIEGIVLYLVSTDPSTRVTSIIGTPFLL